MEKHEFVSVALVKQNAERMYRIVLSSVACPSLSQFLHYLMNATFLEKKITEHKMCDVIFSTTFV